MSGSVACEHGRVWLVMATLNTSRPPDAELEEDQEDNIGKTDGI